MHSFCFNLLCCLHFNKTSIPVDLVAKIFVDCSEVRKEWRQQEQVPPFQGLSKSARKRRAARLDRCIGCGAFSHSGKCKTFPTTSQNDFKDLIDIGAIRLKAERPLRKNSLIELRVEEELNRIKDKLQS